MTHFPDVFSCGFVSGMMRYDTAYPGRDDAERIVLTLGVESIANTQAIVDTGSPWCVIDPEIADLGEVEEEYESTIKIKVRGMDYTGTLIRSTITLEAEQGDTLTMETTFFVPRLSEGESWPHPNFIGLGGFLNKIRFAVDSEESAFYFGF